jgi:plastocyanin
LALGAASLAVALALTLVGFDPRPAAAQSTVTVDIVDYAFDPGLITIEAGTTVVWVNSGAETHSATGDGGEFDTGGIAPGGSASISFDAPGTYGYHCEFHSGMNATVVVVESMDDGTTDDSASESGATDLPTTGSGLGGLAGNSSIGFGAILAALGLLAMATSRVLGRRSL